MQWARQLAPRGFVFISHASFGWAERRRELSVIRVLGGFLGGLNPLCSPLMGCCLSTPCQPHSPDPPRMSHGTCCLARVQDGKSVILQGLLRLVLEPRQKWS